MSNCGGPSGNGARGTGAWTNEQARRKSKDFKFRSSHLQARQVGHPQHNRAHAPHAESACEQYKHLGAEGGGGVGVGGAEGGEEGGGEGDEEHGDESGGESEGVARADAIEKVAEDAGEQESRSGADQDAGSGDGEAAG